jgi:cysteinyl-tRNA synthetase
MTPGQQGRGAWFDSMELKLYDTLTREKRVFTPLDPADVRMYVCGPTVYDFAHIGNARPLIVFDVLFRLLRHLYRPEHVTYVRNITDVDDKINARAAADYPDLPLNEAIRVLTEKTEAQFHADVDALGCLRPTVEPRATGHIGEMRELIERLIASGHAYVAEDHVLFAVPSMPDYGKLSGRTLDEMIAGARVEVAPYKRDPMDFVLWKPSKPGEPSWPSPAGIPVPGRPGWHIECSAMSWKHLGQAFDIHGGGIDLVFPHHENEIAQSRCAFDLPVMANVWMHNGFLQVEGEKMAKSLGNFVTIHELLSRWPGEVLRFNMLRTHYHQPINWTLAGLEESFRTYFELLDVAEDYAATNPDPEFLNFLMDDLNTPGAISRLHELRSEALAGNIEGGAALRASLLTVGLAQRPREDVMVMPELSQGVAAAKVVHAFMTRFPQNYPVDRALAILRRSNLEGLEPEVDAVLMMLRHAGEGVRVGDVRRFDGALEQINLYLERRLAARAARDFKEADRIRDELAAMGIELKDAKDQNTGELVTTWEVAR